MKLELSGEPDSEPYIVVLPAGFFPMVVIKPETLSKLRQLDERSSDGNDKDGENKPKPPRPNAWIGRAAIEGAF